MIWPRCDAVFDVHCVRHGHAPAVIGNAIDLVFQALAAIEPDDGLLEVEPQDVQSWRPQGPSCATSVAACPHACAVALCARALLRIAIGSSCNSAIPAAAAVGSGRRWRSHLTAVTVRPLLRSDAHAQGGVSLSVCPLPSRGSDT